LLLLLLERVAPLFLWRGNDKEAPPAVKTFGAGIVEIDFIIQAKANRIKATGCTGVIEDSY
jgi:hypothetical protein